MDDETAAIQRALNAAAHNGGTVHLSPGPHLVTSITIPSGVTLDGGSRRAVLLSEISGDGVCTITRSHRCTIRGLHVRNTRTETSRGTRVCDAIRVSGSNDCVISDCLLEESNFGVRCTAQCTNVRIENCLVRQNAQSGILLHLCVDCTITKCASNANGTSSLHHGIYISHTDSHGCKILESTCTGNAGSGVQVYGRDHVVNGEFSENHTNGIIAANAQNLTLKDCICATNHRWGAYLDTIDASQLLTLSAKANGLGGIMLKNAREVRIDDGDCSRNGGPGIYLNGSVPGEVMHSCWVVGVTCNDNSTAEAGRFDGIRLTAGGSGTSYNVFARCKCGNTETGSQTQRTGISIGDDCLYSTVSDCHLSRNVVENIENRGRHSRIFGNTQ